MKEKTKILVVDDEESHRIMLRAVLKDEGYEVAEAADGSEAVRAVEQEPFDLVLLDVRMKTMDGIEALNEIRKISPLIPVLIMTAYASVKTAVEALKAGAFDYLTKPLDIGRAENPDRESPGALSPPRRELNPQRTFGRSIRFFQNYRQEPKNERAF